MEGESFFWRCWSFLSWLWHLLDEGQISLGTADGCLAWWMDLSYCFGNQIFSLNISVGLRTRMSTFIYISASTSCSHQYSPFAGVRVSATSLKSCRGFFMLWFRFLLGASFSSIPPFPSFLLCRLFIWRCPENSNCQMKRCIQCSWWSASTLVSLAVFAALAASPHSHSPPLVSPGCRIFCLWCIASSGDPARDRPHTSLISAGPLVRVSEPSDWSPCHLYLSHRPWWNTSSPRPQLLPLPGCQSHLSLLI